MLLEIGQVPVELGGNVMCIGIFISVHDQLLAIATARRRGPLNGTTPKIHISNHLKTLGHPG
jgi:hypothetical protein